MMLVVTCVPVYGVLRPDYPGLPLTHFPQKGYGRVQWDCDPFYTLHLFRSFCSPASATTIPERELSTYETARAEGLGLG